MYYSASTMKSISKPPLPKSPMRLRSRYASHSSNSTALQTPPGSLTKSQKPLLNSPEMRPEYRTMSSELRALTKMVRDGFGNEDLNDVVAVANSCGVKKPSVTLFERGRLYDEYSARRNERLFERGRFYDEYSARRNERLKRKKGVTVDEGKAKPVYGLGVTMESGKKSSVRKFGTLRKSVSAAYSAEVSETPRYMLRSMSKENKKPPIASKFDKSVIGGEKKVGGRRSGRI